MKEKDEIIKKINKNKKEKISEANIDGKEKNTKGVYLLLGLVILLLIAGITYKLTNKNESSDAIKFKENYESMNGVKNSNGLEHRKVNIDKDNPYVFSTPDEIVKKIENKETFYLYVGDKQCPWCRSVIEKSIEVAKDYNIKKIYYLNIWDDDHNEILRDKYELDEDNKPKKVSNGTKSYDKLLEYFDELLNDYTLTDSEGNKIEVGEKRIFAPNYIYVKDGKAVTLISGNSEKQKDSREKLTEEILLDEQKQFEEFFSIDSVCEGKC